MAVSKELLLAILFMDSDNRSYARVLMGLMAGSQIGSATLQALPNSVNTTDWENVGFYAAAYFINTEQ